EVVWIAHANYRYPPPQLSPTASRACPTCAPYLRNPGKPGFRGGGSRPSKPLIKSVSRAPLWSQGGISFTRQEPLIDERLRIGLARQHLELDVRLGEHRHRLRVEFSAVGEHRYQRVVGVRR